MLTSSHAFCCKRWFCWVIIRQGDRWDIGYPASEPYKGNVKWTRRWKRPILGMQDQLCNSKVHTRLILTLGT